MSYEQWMLDDGRGMDEVLTAARYERDGVTTLDTAGSSVYSCDMTTTQNTSFRRSADHTVDEPRYDVLVNGVTVGTVARCWSRFNGSDTWRAFHPGGRQVDYYTRRDAGRALARAARESL